MKAALDIGLFAVGSLLASLLGTYIDLREAAAGHRRRGDRVRAWALSAVANNRATVVGDQGEAHSMTKPELSSDLFPRRRIRHWIAARGNPVLAMELAELEARDRRRMSLRLSGHGTVSADAGEDRGGSRRIAPRLRVVGARPRVVGRAG